MNYIKILKDKIEMLQGYKNFNTKGEWQYYRGNDKNFTMLQADASAWQIIQSPKCLGDRDYWFRKEYTIPSDIYGIGVEGTTVFLRNKGGVQAPTEIYINGNKVFSERYWADLRVAEVIVSEKAVPGETFDIIVHIETNYKMQAGGFNFIMTFDIEKTEDVIFQINTFVNEMKYCSQFVEIKDLYNQAIAYAEQNIRESSPFEEILQVFEKVRKMLLPALTYTKQYTVHLTGHAHIDMNWKWIMEDTIDTCRRDFSTVTNIMDKNPDFRFSQSQVAVYDITEKHFPKLFEKIGQYIEAGNWDISTAAHWTECDKNMPGGEALIRQILYSKDYIKSRFGKVPSVCWEPDTFGHAVNIPQIMKKSGVKNYFHMRCGNGEPIYWWKGLDGTKILTYNEMYNGEVSAERIVRISNYLKNNHGLKDAMLVFGVGDHGGGPTRRDIERARFLNSLPTMPKVIFSTPRAFFDCIQQQQPQNIPVHNGELNTVFEGCYTSHTDIKQYNRYCENKLLEAESSGALATFLGKSLESKTIDEGWKTVLFNQFHDILDGCAIHETYEYADKELKVVLNNAKQLINDNLRHLSDNIKTKQTGLPIAVWNLQGFARKDIVSIDLSTADLQEGNYVYQVTGSDGKDAICQVYDGKLYFIAEEVPAFGYKVYYLTSIKESNSKQLEDKREKDDILLENDYYQLTISRQSGCILYLYDKQSKKKIIDSRHWLANSSLPYLHNYDNNLFSVLYEMPYRQSAWVIGPISKVEYLQRGAKVNVLARGPVMDIVEIKHKVNQSSIYQRLVLYKNMRRIDFNTELDWHEIGDYETDTPMLKVTFRPELKGETRATYDVQFGNVERFADGSEQPAQKWVDVSNEEYGFSLLNDCKYGFDIHGNSISMTCLRTTYLPDPVAEKGKHSFNYALYPHIKGWREANTPSEAAAFNSPLIAMGLKTGQEGSFEEENSWITVEGNGVIVSSFKKPLKQEGIVLRIYEAFGRKTDINVKVPFDIHEVKEIAMTEDNVYRFVELNGNGFTDELKEYEVKTYLII